MGRSRLFVGKKLSRGGRVSSKYGNLDVPTYYVTDDGVRLGNWLTNLRSVRNGKDSRKTELTDEQIQKLDELDFAWEGKHHSAWEKSYLAACAYKKANGNLDIPVAYVTEDGCRLGRWIRRQKEKFEILSESRKKKLLALDLEIKTVVPWDEKFALVERYYREHGNVNLPANYVVEGVWLARWLSEQVARMNGKSKGGKTLTEDQIKRLNSMGIFPNVSRQDIAWEEQYLEAKAFFDVNGNLNVSKRYTSASGKNLGVWVQRQRTAYKNGKLLAEQIEKLDTIGMVWEFEDPWAIGYEHTEKYFQQYGDLRVPSGFVCDDGYRLGTWISNQRSAYNGSARKGLSVEQIERLERIGMIWSLTKRS